MFVDMGFHFQSCSIGNRQYAYEVWHKMYTVHGFYIKMNSTIVLNTAFPSFRKQ
jgi:hypothetical protein